MGFSENQRSSPAGMMLLTSRAKSKFDAWKITQNGCTVRIYPELANGTVVPIRLGDTESHITNWVNGDHSGIQFVGGGEGSKEPLTILLSIVGDDKQPNREQRRGMQIWKRITKTFYGKLEAGVAPSHWSKWAAERMGSVFGPKARTRPKPIWFIRGMLITYNTTRGPVASISPRTPKLNCILTLGPAAQDALRSVVMEMYPDAVNYHGDDYSKMFKYENQLIHPTTGCLIKFGGRGAASATQPVNINFSGKAEHVAEDDDKFKVDATVLTSAVTPIPADLLKDIWSLSWNDVLQVWKDEAELVRALESGIPDEVIIEAFRDEPELMSERLQTRMHRMDKEHSVGTVRTPQVNPFSQQPDHNFNVVIPDFAGAQPVPNTSAGQPDVTPTSTVSATPPPVTVASAPASGGNSDINKMLEALQQAQAAANKVV